jgi:DEAD/DEAH box helicase domain-containing protein
MLPALLEHLRLNRDFTANVVAWEKLPARPARTVPLPETLDPES